jgi:heme-degrading monooxygenase HmoA
MFVQVIRYQLKAGQEEAARRLWNQWRDEQAPQAPGFKGAYLLREKQAPNRYLEVVLFENEQLAQQNSNRPETNQFSQSLMQLCEGDLEFIDTEQVDSYLM